MDIYKILRDEHRQMLLELNDLLRTPASQQARRKRLALEAIDELTAHMQAEEQVLYDRVAESAAHLETTREAKEEHQVLHTLLGSLRATRVEDERYHAKVKVLLDVVTRHIEDEESEMFPAAQSIFDDVIARNFAGEYVALKNEISARPPLVRMGQNRIKRAVDDVRHVLRPQTREP